MLHRTLLRTFLSATVVLTASALHAHAPTGGAPTSSITLDTGVTFPALPGQSTAGGEISFTAPFIDGQARTNLNGIVHMKLPHSRDEKAGAHCLQLSNGDRIVGDLVALDEDVVVFDSHMLGELEISRDAVLSVARRDQTFVILDSVFPRDGRDAWRSTSPLWSVTRDGLCVGQASRSNLLYRLAPHKGPVTIVVDMDAGMNPAETGYKLAVTLFTNSTERTSQGSPFAPATGNETESLRFEVSRQRCDVSAYFRFENRTKVDPFNSAIHLTGNGWPAGKGELRITYDPGTFTIQAWANEELLRRHTLVRGPQDGGQYVHISPAHLVNLRSVRMYRGVLPPGVNGIAPADDADAVLLLNGDRLDAATLEIDDGRCIATTAAANEFKPDVDKIGYIVMRKKGRRALPMRKDDIRVLLQETSVQLKLDKLTDELLTGSSAALGKLSIPRNAVRGIEFDISGNKRRAGTLRPAKSLSVTLADGVILPATVASCDTKQAVVSAPWLTGVVPIVLSKLTRIDLRHLARPEPGAEMLFLTDGSRIMGAAQSISAETFALRTKFLGTLKAPRKFVKSLSMHQQATLLDATDFAAGTPGKWQTFGGRWQHLPTGLCSEQNSGARCLYQIIPHKGAVTVEVAVGGAKNPFAVRLAPHSVKPAILTTAWKTTLNYEGVVFDFGPRAVTLTNAGKPPYKPLKHAGVHKPPKGRKKLLSAAGGVMTMTWDPATNTAQAWRNDVYVGSRTMKDITSAGNHILLGAYTNGVIFASVRVWQGCAAAGPNDEMAKADKDVAVSKAGKTTPSDQFTMADGEALAELDRIMTATNSRTDVPRKPEHVRVGLSRSVILLHLKSMDTKVLEGDSPTLGTVRIPRDAVRWIEIKPPARR